jgi:hypothetical protein
LQPHIPGKLEAKTAVFNKRLPETVNQHIYDEVNATEKTNKVLARQTCISGHQDLHFATTEKDGHSKDFGNTKDTISAYTVPWDKLQLSRENRQNIKSYAGSVLRFRSIFARGESYKYLL